MSTSTRPISRIVPSPRGAIIAKMHDTEISDFEQPNGVDLAEFLPPRVGVLSRISDRRDIVDSVRPRFPKDTGVLRPRDLAPHRFTAVVIVMWVRNQNCIGVEVRRKVVS